MTGMQHAEFQFIDWMLRGSRWTFICIHCAQKSLRVFLRDQLGQVFLLALHIELRVTISGEEVASSDVLAMTWSCAVVITRLFSSK